MHWIDWLIVIIPVSCVLGLAIYSRKYVRGVADFLAAGRVAGRYVIAVGDMAASASVLAVVAAVEMKYNAGFGVFFWSNLFGPVGIIMALTGFCIYRFRETKALSIGQFLEMRYNRSFRICASAVRTTADVCTNAIGPAITANFFIYFLGFPHKISALGVTIPTFMLVVGLVLFMAMLVIWPGGRISLLVTDCIQGLLSYPIFVVIIVFVIYNYSWFNDVAPVMMDRAQGESFLNPFDIEKLRDFNLFAMIVLVVGRIVNRGAWIGNDTSGAGRTPHEQKMAGMLGAWRNSSAWIMYMLIAFSIITVMSHERFAGTAKKIRVELSNKVAEEVVSDPATRALLETKLNAIPEQHHKIGIDKPLSQKENLDTPYLDAAGETLRGDGKGNFLFQKFRTLYSQMMMPIAFRQMLPVGMMGVFCLLMVMLMISTDDSRIMNCSSTIFQDVIMPFFKKELSPRRHLFLLRVSALVIAIFFFLISMFLTQLDYIQMIITAVAAIWLGGAGPIMLFGLYSRFGNTVGAFSGLVVGSGFSICGLILQRTWAYSIYPFIDKCGWTESIDAFLRMASAPFSPYVVWKMNPVKFPINSYEFYFVAIISGFAAYIAGSLLTYKKPYNLDRMLHRGKYSVDGEKHIKSPWTMKNLFNKLITITPDYTRGDKIIAWAVFGYSVVYTSIIAFLGVLVWNLISPWPLEWWSDYFLITVLVIPGIVAAISTVWFTIGGIIDARRLFSDLAKRVDNPLDDGRVQGHVSLMEVDKLGCDPDGEDGQESQNTDSTK